MLLNIVKNPKFDEMRPLIHLFFLVTSLNIYAQKNSTGLIFNDEAYNILPLKASLTRSIYEAIPPQASLKAYCPNPGNQNPFGTCVGWASSYGARTILWAKQHRVTDKSIITENAFSPDFVYRSIVPESRDNQCELGAQVHLALEFLKKEGDVLKKDFHSPCPSNIPDKLLEKADTYRIEDFVRLFGVLDEDRVKIHKMKKSLSEGNPVVTATLIAPSFNNLDTPIWKPSETLKENIGGHALCVVGYDDNKYGGAFEILNSWGTSWGDNGFFWMTYKDFAQWTVYAFELINNIQPIKPEPPPTPSVVIPVPKPQEEPIQPPLPVVVVVPEKDTNVFDFSGSMRFVEVNNAKMTAYIQEVRGLSVGGGDDNGEDISPKPKINPENFKLDTNLTVGRFTAYRMDKAYTEGTKFRLYLNNNEPAYVYAIAMDNTNQAVVLFPYKPSISPILNYKNNEVALPSEDKYIVMDNVRGTDIFCLLYSKEPLDIQNICKQLEQETGTFFQRLYKTMQNKLVDRQHLCYYNDQIRFEVKSNGTGTVVPIVVEIPHN